MANFLQDLTGPYFCGANTYFDRSIYFIHRTRALYALTNRGLSIYPNLNTLRCSFLRYNIF